MVLVKGDEMSPLCPYTDQMWAHTVRMVGPTWAPSFSRREGAPIIGRWGKRMYVEILGQGQQLWFQAQWTTYMTAWNGPGTGPI